MNAMPNHGPRAWTSRRWGSLAAVVFLVQVAVILVLGARQPAPIRAVTPAPSLQLANANDQFTALSDPTLFALPHTNDFGAAKRRQKHEISAPDIRWTEPPRWLSLDGADLLKALDGFMRTNPFATQPLDFKPEPIFSAPALPAATHPPPPSTLNLRGELARRVLLNATELTSALTDWPEADVIAPSKVQLTVNRAGQVVSAVLLPPDYGLYGIDAEAHDDNADRQALKLARSARFAPGPRVTVGQMMFNWHAVPISAGATNAPANLP